MRGTRHGTGNSYRGHCILSTHRSSLFLVHKNAEKGLIPYLSLVKGDIEVYGIAGLSFLSSDMSVILILVCSIAVSPVVCGFSSFCLTVFSERRSFTIMIAVQFILCLIFQTYLPGQLLLLHCWVSLFGPRPEQSAAPGPGGGLVQVRVRECSPIPQLELHWLQELHCE